MTDACLQAQRCLEEGYKLPFVEGNGTDVARVLWAKAVTLGSAPAGVYLAFNTNPVDTTLIQQTINLGLMDQVETGDHHVLAAAGFVRVFGVGVMQNTQIGINLLQRASELGNTLATLMLKEHHEFDPKTALMYYKKACDQLGRVLPGNCRNNAPLETKILIQEFRAEKNIPDAHFTLAILYSTKIPKEIRFYNLNKAIEHCKIAAEKGDPRAKNLLIKLEKRGKGGCICS
jgi:TPR repeat protein